MIPVGRALRDGEQYLNRQLRNSYIAVLESGRSYAPLAHSSPRGQSPNIRASAAAWLVARGNKQIGREFETILSGHLFILYRLVRIGSSSLPMT